MDFPSYFVHINESYSTYTFESIGKKGVVQKTITFSSTDKPGYYNLGLGDINTETGKVEDSVVTDNGDTAKIMATVYEAVRLYSHRYPDRAIFIAGNSPSRNRLYRIAINHSILDIIEEFSVYGFKSDHWELFKPVEQYEYFLVIPK